MPLSSRIFTSCLSYLSKCHIKPTRMRVNTGRFLVKEFIHIGLDVYRLWIIYKGLNSKNIS